MKKIIILFAITLSLFNSVEGIIIPTDHSKNKKLITKPVFNKISPKSNNLTSQTSNIQMVFVQGGSFDMGSNNGLNDEKPVHRVTLSSFYIGKYEVTQAQWEMIMGSNPSNFQGCDECPVEQISWYDVQDFIKKLNQKTGKTYRLPTEAEWEYSAKGGSKSNGYTYSGSNVITNVAWYKENSNAQTHEAGQKQANELGIYDMTGNVWEWCSDWYDSNYYANSPTENPTGPTTGSGRVIRGGCWSFSALSCPVAHRIGLKPGAVDYIFGFRLVLVP